jgi:hypothetical protein
MRTNEHRLVYEISFRLKHSNKYLLFGVIERMRQDVLDFRYSFSPCFVGGSLLQLAVSPTGKVLLDPIEHMEKVLEGW